MAVIRKKRIGLRPKLQNGQLIPSEYQECKAFWQYAVAKGFSDYLVKHCNERKENDPWFVKSLLAIGLAKGLPDYQYIIPNAKYHSLWLEMKRKDQRNEKKRPEQDTWIARLKKVGHYSTYAYGCDDAIKIYTDYVNNRL